MSRVRAAAANVWLGDGFRGAARTLRSVGRKVRGAPRTLRYYHRVDDPRSWLLASQLGAFVDAYGLALELEVVPAAAADVDPEPDLRAKLDTEDTRRLARACGVEFPEPGFESVVARVRLASAIALVERPARERLDLLVLISSHLLARSGDALAGLADDVGVVPGVDLGPALESGYKRLRKRGFFTGGVVAYEGEFYPGVERLRHLERRLVAEGLPDRGLALEMPTPMPVPGEPVDVDVFFSFRSPYSYLGVERIARLADEHGLRLRLRPVMPMVMRGLAVPPVKRLYIVSDAKREASAHGLPFGRIADPVGLGVERCLAVVHHAARVGKELDFARVALRAIWAEGVDMTTDDGLRRVAASVGLDADFIAAALADSSFRASAEANREAMYELGSWGVPTFRVGSFTAWGQDRLPLVLGAVNELRHSR